MKQDVSERQADQNRDDNWRFSLLAMISARVEIAQIELRQLMRERSRSLVCLLAAAACALFTWALLLAGSIAAIAEASGWPWHFIALIAAAIHLVAALALLKAAKAPKAPAFPATRSEFQKDREWIQSLQKTPESRN